MPADLGLYRRQELAADLGKKPFVLCGSEESANAANRLIGNIYVAAALPLVPDAWRVADLQPLLGRPGGLIIPDGGQDSRQAAERVADRLHSLGATNLRITTLNGQSDDWKLCNWAGSTDEFIAWAKAHTRDYEPVEPVVVEVVVAEKPEKLKRKTIAEIFEERALKAEENKKANPQYQLWQKWGLQMGANHGPPLANLNNAVAVLENDPILAGSMWYDTFLRRVMTGETPREWGDQDDISLTLYVQRVVGIAKFGRDIISQAVIHVAHANEKNCVLDWINSLAYDGTPRLDQFFSDYMGAEDNEYVRAASRNFWISMAARINNPGCKVDNMIVLEGSQGVGKSTAMSIIGGEWFAEQHESATNPKAFAEILQGKLLVEISEMDSFNRAEVNRVKQTISCPSDRFRASYGRHALDHPRTCIFVGTTNRDDWNRDETGARRFWPIACRGAINLDGIRENRDQLFAEAQTRYKAREAHWQMPAEATKGEQESRYQYDPWQPKIENILKGKAEVTMDQVMEELGIELIRRGKAEQMRVGTVLRFLGWTKDRRRTERGREYYYVPPE